MGARPTEGVVITRESDPVAVTAQELLVVCAWCVPPARLAALNRQYACSHSLCPACEQRILAEDASA